VDEDRGAAEVSAPSLEFTVGEETTVPADVGPVFPDLNVDYPCQHILPNGERCNKEAGPYGGRGRKPRFCSEHKPTRGTASVGRRAGANAVQAQAALDALVNMHTMGAMGLAVVGMSNTANAVFGTEEGFRAQMLPQLQANPKRCAQILRAGAGASEAGFFAAYAMFAAAVIPVAKQELDVKRSEARERRMAA
jgi:hypothetical protein